MPGGERREEEEYCCMKPHNPVALFDSGVGGLSVYLKFKEILPRESVIYVGDTAHVPYGPKPAEEIREYILNILPFLLAQEVKAILFACNTSSSLVLPELEKEFPVPLVGVILPGVRKALEVSRSGKIGVIANEATVRSGYFLRQFALRNPQARVAQQPCPGLVEYVEEGVFNSPSLRETLKKYLLPLKEKEIDLLLLGCTHYPFLSQPIQEIMGHDVTLVDPALPTVVEVRDILEKKKLLNSQGGPGVPDRFYCTGDPGQFQRTAVKITNLDGFQALKLPGSVAEGQKGGGCRAKI